MFVSLLPLFLYFNSMILGIGQCVGARNHKASLIILGLEYHFNIFYRDSSSSS